jgi:uncharacterized membrane protein
MENDKLQQLENDVRHLQQELQATQARLHQVMQQLHILQTGHSLQSPPDTNPSASSGQSFFKTPYQSHFSVENFIGLRLIHLVGIVVLVIGLSIGVKYALDKELISEVARIGLAYAAGTLLFLLSLLLRKRYTAFSAILFSGAMASLYFTSYAAFVYYQLFSFAVVFVLMILLTLFTVFQALTYNRQEIAVLGLVGAYGIPFLISSNTGRAELLFTFIALINVAVVFLAYKRGWRSVVLLAQGITWLLLIGWALTRFTVAQQPTAYGFAGFFFLLFCSYYLSGKLLNGQPLQRTQVHQVLLNNILFYVVIAVAYSAGSPAHPFRFINAFFSFFLAIQAGSCYLFLRSEAYLKSRLVLFSIILFLLFIAVQWDGFSVTLLWLLVAIVLFVVGFGTKAVWLRLSAMVLLGVTLAKLVFLDSQRFSTLQKILAYLTLGVLLLVVGFFYQRFKEKLFQNEAADA